MKKTALYVIVALLVLASQTSAQTPPLKLLQTFPNPKPHSDDNFGAAIAVDGNNMLVGGPGGEEVAYLLDGKTGGVLEVLQTPNLLPRLGQNFGAAVALSGNNVLIGAPAASANGIPNAGAAYLYDIGTGQFRTLTKVTPASNDSFGIAVAIAGNKLIIGAPRDDTGGTDAGAVYVFDLDSAQASPRTIVNPFPGDFDFFGAAVVAIGTNFAVGVPSDSPTYSDNTTVGDAGSVYLYNSAGERIGTFPNPTRSVAGSFGVSLAAYGNDILVGAPSTVLTGTLISAGAAHLIQGSSGSLIQTFTNPTPASGDRFGAAVAVVGNNILIGAPFDDSDSTNAGAAYLFNGAGNLIMSFQNPTPRVGDQFGFAVAAFGDSILVGTPFKEIAATTDAGAVYLFGAGATPLVSFSSDSLKYGNVLVNANSNLTVRLTNTGTADLSINSTSLAGANANQFSIVSGGGAGTLTPNVARDITLRFSPNSVGNKIAFFVLNSNATSTPDTVTLTGTGVAALPTCSLSITSIQNGAQVFTDSVLVRGKVLLTNIIPPFTTRVTVNGILATTIANTANGAHFSADVPLPVIGPNQIIINTRIIGVDTVFCADSIAVIRASGTPKTCVDFESLPFDTKYGTITGGISDTAGAVIFRENNIPVSLQGFKEIPTGSTFFDFCQIDSAFRGFGTGQVMRVANINLKFDFTRLSTSVNKVTFDFIDLGGSENIAVNDGTILIGNLPKGVTNIAPGVTLDVDTVHVSGGEIGKVTLIGSIKNLLIGGQEFWLDNICAQDTFSCQLVIKSPSPNAILCSDSVTVKAATRIVGGVPPFSFEYEVNGVKATFADTNLAVKVPLSLGANSLIATSTITDSSGQRTVCVDSVKVTRQNVSRDLVINEILYDPNNDDLGYEKIELKNIDSTTVVSLDSMALWVRREALDTYWIFPSGIKLAPGQLLVVHWLRAETRDDGNIFTGLPDVAARRFWGNNSIDSTNMTLGGAGNNNTKPFSIALMRGIVFGQQTGFNDPCNMIDFVQICGRVTKSESLAVEAGLWPRGSFLACSPEGNSQSRQGNDQYTQNPNPSLGSDNILPSALPAQHLLISEVCVRPDNSEFVEIYNPSDSTISLSDYYLTDNVNEADDAAYTRLVKGADSLQIQAGDFFVQFPANAQIGPRQFQTIAFSASSFLARYNVKPTYEIRDDDPAVANMDTIKVSTGILGLNDADEALVLLKWVKSDSSDLVQDIDYVVWGEPIIVNKPGFAPLQAIGEAQETKSIAAIKAPALGINKTGVGLDGLDRNNAKSYYNNETLVSNQRPIANTAHANLKSWQRTDFSEPGEKKAGGNGISGHDETSENLAANFKEAKPTPGGAEQAGPLDGLSNVTVKTIEDDPAVDVRLRNVGFPNKIINPGEIVKINIQLRNSGPLPSGRFFTILRPQNPFVTMMDSISNFSSIAVGDSGVSLSFYVFEVAKMVLPDSLDFKLILIQKSSSSTSNKPNQQAELSAVTVRETIFSTRWQNITFDIAFKFTVNPIRSDSTNLTFGATIKNCGTLPSTDTRISGSRSADTTIIKKVLSLEQNPGTIAVNATRVLDPINFALVDTFKSQPTSFDLAFSWQHTATQRLQYPVTIATLMPDTFEVAGKLAYFNDDAIPIPDVIVSLFRHASLVPDTTDTTDASGNYSFHLLGNDAGQYKIIANRVQLPSAPNVSIFTGADRDSAQALRNRIPSSTKNDEVFKRLAADVDGDGMLTNADTCAVGALARNQSPESCSSSIRQGWAFVDAITPVKNDKFSLASDTLNLILNNYSVTNLNFTGIIYGDVDSSASRLFMLPAGRGSENILTSTPTKTAQSIPGKFFLAQNYPNPFNPTTRIEYGLSKDAHVVVEIFNIVGQLVYTGVDSHQKAGYYQIDWTGIEQSGKPAPAGVYLMRLRAGKFSQMRKLLLVK